MDNKKLLSVLIAASVATPAAFAMSDAELEARMKKYEDKIKSLEAEVKDLKSKGTSTVYVEDLQNQEKRNAKQIADIKDKMDSNAQKLKMNGFMTAAVSKSDNNLGTAYDMRDTANFVGDAKMGMQFNYKMDDKADATVQLIARSRGSSGTNNTNSWNVEAEWAYLGYQLTDDLKLRMGRLRTPFYMYSETLDVGYSYPWVRPPIEMYRTELTSYNGADMLYKFNIGSINNTLQFFTGAQGNADHKQGDSDLTLDMNIRDLYGVNLTSTWGDWTARAMAATLSINGSMNKRLAGSIPASYLPPDMSCSLDPVLSAGAGMPICASGAFINGPFSDRFDYYAVGGQYDNGSLFVISELARLNAKRAQLISDEMSGYITGGYRIDKWTPFVTYAKTYDIATTKNLAQYSMMPTAHDTVSLGIRRELTNSLSAKFQADHLYKIENNGGFGDNPGDTSNVYTFALDAVF